MPTEPSDWSALDAVGTVGIDAPLTLRYVERVSYEQPWKRFGSILTTLLGASMSWYQSL